MPIKFAYFCDLLEQLERLEQKHRQIPVLDKRQKLGEIVQTWTDSFRKHIDGISSCQLAILSSLFPSKRTDRVYNIQSTTLVKILARALSLGTSRARELESWSISSNDDLGTWAGRVVKPSDTGVACVVTLEDVDVFLDNLGSRSRFSDAKIRAQALASHVPPTHEAIAPMVCRLPSRELKWLVRLILKDLPIFGLEEEDVAKSIHPVLPLFLKPKAHFCDAMAALSEADGNPVKGKLTSASQLPSAVRSQLLRPVLGQKIGRPYYIKARSVKNCIEIAKNRRWALEAKFDGEYCQVHIDLSKAQPLQIFAKSGKDATRDRVAAHSWIKQCLRVGQSDCAFAKQCIVEGEILVIDTRTKEIQPFHKIRKYVRRSGRPASGEADSGPNECERLIVIFYDCLMIDDEATLLLPYAQRRDRLHSLLHTLDGLPSRSNWGEINFASKGLAEANRYLEQRLAEAIAERCEGLILKPCNASYIGGDDSDLNSGTVIKLKKDYIPGLGDTADFAVIAAARNVGRSTNVETKWTHFIVASLENKQEVLERGRRPLYRIVANLGRPCVPPQDIRELNKRGLFCSEPYIAGAPTSRFDIVRQRNGEQPQMDVIFTKPFIVEVLGSSFEKRASHSSWMLRHPRIVKIHDDRGLEDVISFGELQAAAATALNPPPDVLEEEVVWRQRLKAEGRPKGDYVCSKSPATRTTVSTNTTPRTRCSPKKMEIPPVIREDTSERLANESNLPSPPSTDENMRDRPTTITSRQEPGYTSLDGCDEREPPGNVLRPLQCIGNLSAPPRLVPSTRLLSPFETDTEQVDEVEIYQKTRPIKHVRDDQHADERGPRKRTRFQDKSTKPRTGAEDSYPVTQSDDPSTSFFTPPESASESDATPGARRSLESRVASEHNSGTLQNTAILLSPCVRSHLFLTETLLPPLKPGYISTTLSHWVRDVRPAITNSILKPALIAESQALPGLQKIVLVEPKRPQQTKFYVEHLVDRILLCQGEEVFIVDWRWIDSVVISAPAKYQGIEIDNQYLQGTISFSGVDGGNVFHHADFEDE